MERCSASPSSAPSQAASQLSSFLASLASGAPPLGVAAGLAAMVLVTPTLATAQDEPRDTSRPRPGARAAAAAPPVSNAAPPATPPGQGALERARTAWDKGDFDVSEPLYAEAVERGGLAPADVLEAYVHLGSARAVLGKKAGALAAFRSAAQLELRFAVPSEAGKRAMAVADQARRLEAKTGPLAFHAEIPDQVTPGAAAAIDVTLDAGHAALPGARIGVYARGAEEGAFHVASVRAGPTAHFDLPAELSLPSTTLRVQVDWLDLHSNRLATAEESIHVQPLATTDADALLLHDGRDARAHDEGRGGFWHTAWPYILGGAALAAGGVAVYFATRPGGDVNVTGVRVLTH